MDLNERAEKYAEAVRDRVGTSTASLAKEWGVSQRTAQRASQRAFDLGYLPIAWTLDGVQVGGLGT